LKSLHCLFFLLCFSGIASQAQNLVPNPSFEEYDVCPMALTVTRMVGPLYWYQPTAGSADYFNSCAKNRGVCGVPRNKLGYQEARTGQGYCGFICYLNEKKLRNYREYLEARLDKRLNKGHTYCVQLHVSLAESSTYAVYNMDVLFSRFAVKAQNDKCIDSIPSASYVSDTALSDYKGWKEIRMTYTAEGGERFITFGNFHTDKKTRSLKLPKNDETSEDKYIKYKEAYYYIDDVCVKDITDTVSCDCDFTKPLLAKDSIRTDSLGKQTYAINQRLVLKNIYFDTDKSILLPASNAELDKLYSFLEAHADLKIRLDGHTDNQGTDEHNLILSRARAEAVKEYLTGKGIAEERIVSEGHGRNQPVAPNDTDAGRQLNRRVEFILSK
jgi:OOP family OmpA-OmpF porin